MAALGKLLGVECERCRAAGHRCQAQVRTDEGALCLRCADDEPCVYEIAAAAARAEQLGMAVDPCAVPVVTREDRKAIQEMPKLPSIHATQGESRRFVLTPEIREAILKDARKRSAAQVAAKYHVSTGTVWNIKSEYRRQLQERLVTPVPVRIGTENVVIAPAAVFGAEMLEARAEETEK